jgi:transposase
MPQNFIACDRAQSLLLPPDLTDWVPDDHVVWSILGAVDQMDLSAFYGEYRENGQGRAAYEPSMMVALLLYSYARREPVLARDRTGVPGGRHLQADHGNAGTGSLDDR